MPPTLLLGRCLDLLPSIPDASVDLIACDLPYGTTACPWDAVIPFEPMWAEFRRVLKPDAGAVLTATQPFSTDLINSNRKWFRYELVWRKSRAVGHLDAKRRPLRAHELVLVFAPSLTKLTYLPQMVAGRPYKTTGSAVAGSSIYGKSRSSVASTNLGTRYPTSVLDFPSHVAPKGERHPTAKPVGLFEWIVRTYSRPGQVVLDCTMGSGTTGVACIRSGREFVGIESDPGYFEIAAKRIGEALPV
jgi:DNA modification methylase